MRPRTLATFLILPLLTTACDQGTVGDADRLAVTNVEALAILELVNDPATDEALLDIDVGLDARAAAGIIETRNGPDGVYPSADDEPFTDLEALDAVPWVGTSALEKLRDWAIAHPATGGEIVEGVMFTGTQAQAIVWGVSNATEHELDVVVGLNAKAADNLVAAGPYTTVAEIGAVPWVGPAALELLQDHAPVWAEALAAADHSGTFDGVAFDGPTADIALAIANEATLQQLVDGGVWSTGAGRIVDNRPYADLADLAAVSGIGPSTMLDLHAFASSGDWGGAAEEPVCDMTLVATSHAAVDGYSDNMVDFDPAGDWTPYHLAALSLPSCFDASSDAGQTALVAAMVAHAQWEGTYAAFPEAFVDRPLLGGSTRFDNLLDASLDHLADVRDDLLSSGSFGADAFYDQMFALYQQVDALGGPTTLSQGLRLDNEECSEEAAVLINADEGLAVVIHRRPGC